MTSRQPIGNREDANYTADMIKTLNTHLESRQLLGAPTIEGVGGIRKGVWVIRTWG